MAKRGDPMDYKAFNLHFITPFECPELILYDVADGCLDKVTIQWGDTPTHLDTVLNSGIIFEANENELLLSVKEVARFYVQDGNSITIEKFADSSDDEIRLFLFGSAIGALLQQRGLLTLHASAIKTDRGAVLFAGASGAGKSTTLQEFVRRGYKQISDDTIALYRDEATGKMICLPSYPQSKIWQNSADLMELDTKTLRQIRPEIQKFALPTFDSFFDAELPLYAIYILNTHQKDEITVESIGKFQRFNIVKSQTYRMRYIKNPTMMQNHFKLASASAQQALFYRVNRPIKIDTLKTFADAIEDSFS